MNRAAHLLALAAMAVGVLTPASAAVATPQAAQAASVLSGTIVLKSRATNLCIDDSAVGLRHFDCQPANGAYIGYQEFVMQPDGAYVILKNVATGLCVDDSSGAGLRGFGCQPHDGAYVSFQEFTVTPVGNFIVLRNLATGLCIDDSGAGLRDFGCQPTNGANIAYQQFSSPVRDAIVRAAQSQIGYQDTPYGTFCNKFTTYWNVGSSGPCGGNGLLAEEWCADFAAWAWQQGGAPFTYGYPIGEINAGAVSFYWWAQAHGTWHAAGTGYTAQPGDAAVYGLNLSAGTADHVAVVSGYSTGGPNVINGDWWDTGNGAVVAATNQGGSLSGYASPSM